MKVHKHVQKGVSTLVSKLNYEIDKKTHYKVLRYYISNNNKWYIHMWISVIASFEHSKVKIP